MSDRPVFHEDIELTRQAQEGDPAARERFAVRLRCVPIFVRSRNATLGHPLNRDDLEDLVQDVVMAVWRKIGLYRGEAPLEGWIYRFCMLELKSYMRRSITRESRSEKLDNETPDKGAHYESETDLYEDIYSGLNRIDSKYAQVIRLKHFGHLTFEEIAERLDVSSNTVKTRYYRGLIRLKGFLDPKRLEWRS
jgi:RNA polymerase sigma-70 factor (ECF subfamily)